MHDFKFAVALWPSSISSLHDQVSTPPPASQGLSFLSFALEEAALTLNLNCDYAHCEISFHKARFASETIIMQSRMQMLQ